MQLLFHFHRLSCLSHFDPVALFPVFSYRVLIQIAWTLRLYNCLHKYGYFSQMRRAKAEKPNIAGMEFSALHRPYLVPLELKVNAREIWRKIQ